MTSMVGRVDEVRHLRRLSETQRLVTLVGPAGVGKTRLALELAPDAPFVELAGVSDWAGVVSAFHRALGIESSAPIARAAAGLRDALAEHAFSRVVVDGCDLARTHVAELLRSLLSSTDRVQFLCTSRHALDLAGEQRFPVDPLPIGGEGSPAEQLFVDRARLVQPLFAADASEREDVRAILALLGGFPLAIELVAAQLPTLGLEGIRRRLASRRPDAALAPLREVIEQSVALLPLRTREALLRLAVFAGSFDFEAAEAVLGELADEGGHLSALVDASLVRSSGTRQPQFVLYEPVRSHAERLLRASPLFSDACARHALHHLERVTALASEGMVWSVETARAIERLVPELLVADAHLRDGSARHENPASARCRLVAAIEPVATHIGALPDHADWIGRAAELCKIEREIPSPLRVRVLSLHGLVLQRQGVVDGARAPHLEAGAIALASGDEGTLARAWLRWLVALVVWGRFGEADVVGTTLLARLDGRDHLSAVARMYVAMARLFGDDRVDEALTDLRRAVIDLGRHGDRRGALIGQANLAVFLLYLDRLDQAKEAFAHLEIDEDADAHTRSSTLANRSLLLHELSFAEDLSGSEELLREADDHYRRAIAALGRASAKPYAALVRAHHAMLQLERGDVVHAELDAVECLHEQPEAKTSALAHAELASIHALRGAPDEARAYLAEAYAIADRARIADAAVLHALELHEEYVGWHERAKLGVRTRDVAARIRSKLKRYSSFDTGPFSPRVRVAARLLRRVLDDARKDDSEPPSSRPEWQGSLVVGRDEAWLRAPGGAQVDLSQRRKLRALVSLLLRRHETARGQPIPPAEVIAHVWPDERFVADTGRTRLHTMVFALRGFRVSLL
ncbi:MAG: ATP-binding protein, partial [Polyangiales bacterium]